MCGCFNVLCVVKGGCGLGSKCLGMVDSVFILCVPTFCMCLNI